MTLLHKCDPYIQLMRLDKPIGILLLLWPTLWALWIAGAAHPAVWTVFVFVMGVILMRSAGCIINDYADRHFDLHVERTKTRPLATGKVTTKAALTLAGILAVTALALTLTLNTLTILLTIPAAALAAIYPLMKRIFKAPQLILGVAFSWGIPMAFAATTGHVSTTAWLLLAANLLWTIAYDTEYAMADRQDDLTIGIHSTAIWFGQFDLAAIKTLQILALTILVGIGYLHTMRPLYFVGIGFAAILMLYQQHLIVNREPAQCLRAFKHNQWVGLVIFLGILF